MVTIIKNIFINLFKSEKAVGLLRGAIAAALTFVSGRYLAGMLDPGTVQEWANAAASFVLPAVVAALTTPNFTEPPVDLPEPPPVQ